MDFEWDDRKAEINLAKHGVPFTEAVTVWFDERALEILDVDHGDEEERWVRIGLSRAARALIVVLAERIEGERRRIISARKAGPFEIKQYNAR